MIKTGISFLAIFLLCSGMHAQPGNKMLFSIEVKAAQVATDVLHHLYLVDSENVFRKFHSNGKELSYYTNNSLGRLTHFDVSNPHKIMLFYKDHQTLVFLDRNLTETSSMVLSEFGFSDTYTAAMSNDNKIWVFDQFDNTLNKIGSGGTVQTISDNTYSIWGVNLRPTQIVERFNRVYVLDPEVGIFIFTNLGTPVDHLKLQEIQYIDPVAKEELILHYRIGSIERYSMRTERRINLSFGDQMTGKPSIQIHQRSGRMVVRYPDQVVVFEL